MAVALNVPTAGESIKEVQVGQWLVRPGEHVERDQAVVTIETDKATLELSAPVAGTLARILKNTGETAAVGEALGDFEEGPASGTGCQPVLEAGKMPALQAGETPAVCAAGVPPASAGETPALPVAGETPAVLVAGETPAPQTADQKDVVVRMSPLRKRIAERLVQAQAAAALLTTFNEVDMSAVMALRQKHKDAFQERQKIKLGLMSFFVKATVDALKLVPQLNAELSGEDILYHQRYDIGIAVAGGKGLVVPVLRNADRMSFAELERAIAGFARRAAENKIGLEELQGSTFTITNGGVFGSLLSTPIVNPPESGILGLHAIQDRPVARDGQVVIRPMMYVALTYDHRLVDGREAVTFLRRIKECVEDPLRMMLEI